MPLIPNACMATVIRDNNLPLAPGLERLQVHDLAQRTGYRYQHPHGYPFIPSSRGPYGVGKSALSP